MKTEHIEPGNYIGYIWKSDRNTPQLLSGEFFSESLNPSQNPFIIEAQLFDSVRNISYSVKYADGRYCIQQWDLSNDFAGDDYEFTAKEYHAHPRMGEQTLLFRQYWKAVPDKLCNDMKVLQPDALVFVGFKL